MRQKQLQKKDLAMIIRLADKLNVLRKKYNDEEGISVPLPNDNYTVGSNLDCAVASLDTITQYYPTV